MIITARDGGIPIGEIKAAGYTAVQCREGGATASEFKTGGFSSADGN